MTLPALSELEPAAALLYATLPATPLIRWPLLCERSGVEVWVKHENHTPVGALKVRGGSAYMRRLCRTRGNVRGAVAATRGNHGQSVAFAAAQAGTRAVIVVSHGNSREKNAAMRALGAELIEQRRDFQDSLEETVRIAGAESLHLFPSFDRSLICGVAARNALGLKTEIVGVCAGGAPACALSFTARRPVATAAADTRADGIACRTPRRGDSLRQRGYPTFAEVLAGNNSLRMTQ